MKQSRILLISIVVVDLILAVVCMTAYFGEDRTAPEFRFQTDEYIYAYGDEEEKLLDNIMAYDNRDGNISERIVIEKIMENRDSSTIVVYYAVSDSAGNVAKISRVFVADFGERENNAEEYADISEETAENAVSDNTVSDDSETENPLSGQTDGGEADASEGTSSHTANGDVSVALRNMDNTEDGDNSEEDNTENEELEAIQTPPAAEPEPLKEDRSGYPILTLRTQEVTIEAGTSPPWTEIIETLRDDKDDYATLYYNLSVSRFNRNQTGDYPVSLYTEDSDGNRSDTVTVTVHVR